MKTSIKNFICPFCNENISDWDSLIEHLIRYHDYPFTADKKYVINRMKIININIKEEKHGKDYF